ncbi:LysR family transcriptional regulator [Larsenimonas rhizosphaerae]|uniref:LysR family transcriptional regulator n=1 Tax=Larsenimonas rhizosphaerae TaxID=2944682 RepID=A0AA42CY00_9GAMM|nr:LysR family transcriptional regulator [Larsenimonas rhizosphaerae]MCM2129835.1 LysR family transcriptional regulator [Larsenimonas rhizosphaerae]MCX2524495.1 LysR family transcriptional regulator [Larsenimonas rhizosphaerae]
MDHRQLRFLVALAQERHFGRAAQRAHVTQPTLSARLKQLETELGTPLIRRGRRFEGFTPEGQRVLLHARRILAEFDELHAELDPAQGPSGWLSLGLVPSALGDMATLLPELRRRFPALRFRVREYTTVSLMQALADDEIALALGYLDVPAAEPFVARPLFEEHYVLMAAAGLSFKTPPDWTTLAHHPLYMLTGDMQHHSLVRRRLEEEGMAVEAVVEAGSLALLAALLRTDQAIAVMPARLVSALPLEGLVTWPLPALTHPARLGLLWKRAHRQSRRLQAVLDALADFNDRRCLS